MRIGIGITTHNRPELLTKALEAHKAYRPRGSRLVVVDDASDVPVEGADFRFEQQAGIARAKNKCLELLVEQGCDHFFLFDDDAWPAAKGWSKPYISSPEPHLMYNFQSPRTAVEDGIAESAGPNGVMLYADLSVLEKVGGMDPRFGIWGYEHVSWSDRIHSAGLTTFRFQDVADHDGLIYAADEHETVRSSTSHQARRLAKADLFREKRGSAEYVEFRSATPRVASTGPVVDVIFLARSDGPESIAMTRHAIDTCVAGAGKHEVNVIVIEQVKGVRYEGAKMIYRTGKFRYNAFANVGIKAGSAPWAMVANNDLDFEPGWLDQLLAANYPIVSPRCPRDQRQRGVHWNEVGTDTGRHLSGWCYMISRELWQKIGGLDEDFIFWCADDSLIEQVVQVGFSPMLVGGARVTHLGSQSGGVMNPDLTWAMIHKFNNKYGKQRLASSPGYLRWKRALEAA